jgi:hypothetical protein
MPVVAYENELEQIDFRNNALAIGIDKGGDAQWMEFTSTELRVLSLLLTKPLASDGSSAADEHPMLRMLAAWALRASQVAREVELESASVTANAPPAEG